VAGVADWSDTESDARRVGLVHAMLNSLGLGCFVWSLLARRGGSRGLGMALSTLGLALASVSAWLGGELVYRLGTGVSRTAWEPSVDEFLPAASADALEEGKPMAGEVTVEGTKVPLVLVKQGAQVLALSATCSHWGGPLAEGKLVDGDKIECPWHGSQFRLSDGSVCQGPATVEQPVFEARIRNGNVEVRRAR
jgi:nitrite reductase/ring-hydroxylating ferredoxin subunit